MPTEQERHDRRVRSNIFIVAFLLFQILVPLRYYLWPQGDDERFSGRMFSSVRYRSCTGQVYEHTEQDGKRRTRRVNLRKTLHLAWVGLLQRDRRQVVDKFLRQRCSQEGVREARYVRRCVDVAGQPLPRVEIRLDCSSGRFIESGP